MHRLVCTACRAEYGPDEPVWGCSCGGILDLEFDASFPLDRIAGRKPGMWRYREAIPVISDTHIVTFGEGFTPLVKMRFEGVGVLVKLEFLFPTGSFKDRGATVLVSKVRELGVRSVVEDSSGNAGCALAAYAAAGGITCRLFVPDSASGAKLAQIRAYGADLALVGGKRGEAARAALEAAEHAYYASHSRNPYFLHGTKTFAYELCEQLGWNAPDTVVLPAGNGTLLLGAYIGFSDLLRGGIIPRLPRLIAVQAARCAPLHQAFSGGHDDITAVRPEQTVAEGIAVAYPVRGRQILEAVKRTGGSVLAVGEEEILEAARHTARRGLYIEPTAAVAVAGLRRYLQNSSPDERIATALTGHGLKAGSRIP
jgi:threonine synthase